jgi:hypothetical protein
MILESPNQSCSDYLSYNAALVGSYPSARSNQIVIKSDAQKRIDGIQACWVPIVGTTDPSTLRQARIIVVEGFVKGTRSLIEDIFVDPVLPINVIKQTLGFNGRVILDLLTSGGSHRIITLGNLGINIPNRETITILQTPMYVSGDSPGQPSATLATLSVQVSEFYNEQKQYDFAKSLK